MPAKKKAAPAKAAKKPAKAAAKKAPAEEPMQYHVHLRPSDIGRYVILPGDPGRVPKIAAHFDNAREVAFNREYRTFTGTVDGIKVSCTSTGIGCPSTAIAVEELIKCGADTFIRIGTCGSYKPEVKLGSLVIAQGACTDSNYGTERGIPGKYSAIADFGLLRKAVDQAEKMGLDYEVGNVMTSDVFYNASPDQGLWPKLGVLAVEMEAYGLYFNAAVSGKKALAILSVSDNVVTGEQLSAEDRAQGLNTMIRLALEIV